MDSSGNCYLTGYFSPEIFSTAIVSVTFGDVTLTTRSGGPDIFVAKYDTEGNLIWVRQAGAQGGDEGAGIAVDGVGNVFVTGSFYQSAIFDAATITGDEYDLFVAKYDSAGNNLWARAGGLPHQCCDSRGFAIVVDGSGSSFVTGSGSEGGVPIAKYDPAGNRVWLREYGGAGYGQGDAIALDASGNLYIAGRLTGDGVVNFGGITLSTACNVGVVITKPDPGGSVVWDLPTGGMANDYAHGIALDNNGNIYVLASIGMPPWGSTVTGTGSQDTLMKLPPPVVNRQLTTLGTAKLWVGLKNSDDVGIKFDLVAEVCVNGVLASSGQLNSVAGGSSGFNKAK